MLLVSSLNDDDRGKRTAPWAILFSSLAEAFRSMASAGGTSVEEECYPWYEVKPGCDGFEDTLADAVFLVQFALRAVSSSLVDRSSRTLSELLRFLDTALAVHHKTRRAWETRAFAAIAVLELRKVFKSKETRDLFQAEDLIWDLARLLADDGVDDEACEWRCRLLAGHKALLCGK